MSLLQRLDRSAAPSNSGIEGSLKHPAADAHFKLKERVRTLTIDILNKETNPDSQRVRAALDEVLEMEAPDLPRPERTRIAMELVDDIIGYGPLESLLSDPEVTEIMVNGPDQMYVEKKGKLHRIDVPFRDNDHVLNIIDRIVSSIGRHVDEASPMVDARLKDGSRVNVIIPPLSLVGPVITIRKFSKIPFTSQNLIEFGSISPKMMSFLEACVKGRLNIIISGGTGSGKTTLLNVISSYIPEDERIVTIEDAAEIQLNQDHVITLESRPPNMEGSGQVTIRDLVRNALRMRPDRIIVGEVRSSEALDMLQAMNTGHDGSLTTTHANSPRDAMARIETMTMMAGMELPLNAIRNQIASAIDIVVQQTRLRDGTRKVTSITEVTGMEGDVISMQEIFTFDTQGRLDNQGRFIGKFRPTGVKPHCLEKIRNNGVTVVDDWFV
ncbi:MAG: putative conjugal transfer protein [Firmicutes bacterium ADurb.Bin182]|nr:MAG: putative conjugal transfer protein [Firmicutes bacterium ADurb.Bin182]